MNKPNIFIIVADHFRSEALGHLHKNDLNLTPNIDKIVSKDAISFKNAFCQNPVCVPSRCSFMSGRYPHVEGYRTMHHLLNISSFNLLTELKQNNYYVYFGGKNDLFKKEIPLSNYCNYRTNVFEEYNCKLKNIPLNKEIHPLLQDVDLDTIIEAENLKKLSRSTPDSKYYYSLYQGPINTANDFSIGYVGLEDRQVNGAIDFINTYKEDKPLCMYLSLMLPHPHYATTTNEFNSINRDKIIPPIRLSSNQLQNKPAIFNGLRKNHKLYQWSNDELIDFKQTYYAMISHVDTNFGKIIDALKKNNFYDNSIIVFISDHGDYAGEYEIAEINQNTFEDYLTNVPFVLKPPKHYKYTPGIRDTLVELIDLPQTIADLTNIKLSEPCFSRSLVPTLIDKDIQIHDFVHCEGGRLNYETHCKDAGHEQTNLYWARTSLQEKIPEHTKAIMIRNKDYKYVYRLYEKNEFYDLNNDPFEKDNLIENKEYSQIINYFNAQLLKHFIETSDYVPFQRDER